MPTGQMFLLARCDKKNMGSETVSSRDKAELPSGNEQKNLAILIIFL
jgi:hypothetical protein